ncbi:MAG: hypothetical protein OSB39_11885 [Opitutales bacterium]|nr:hypothetical protein [Opitutales bacterium]
MPVTAYTCMWMGCVGERLIETKRCLFCALKKLAPVPLLFILSGIHAYAGQAGHPTFTGRGRWGCKSFV